MGRRSQVAFVALVAGSLMWGAAAAPPSTSTQPLAAVGAQAESPGQSVGHAPEVPAPAPPPIDTPMPAIETYAGEHADPLVESVPAPGVRAHSGAATSVRVEVVHPAGSAALRIARELGATNLREATDTIFEATVTPDVLEALEASAQVTYVRAPVPVDAPPTETDGPLATQAAVSPSAIRGSYGGDLAAKVHTATWHARGYLGTGTKIGIFDGFSRALWRSAQAAGELPSVAGEFCMNLGARCDAMPYPAESHGVAVAETIHDMAPNARLYVASATSAADYRAAIDYLAAQGVRIISRSLGAKYDGPGNGTGTSAWLVDYAASKGITWFNSAGNAGSYVADDRLYGGYYRDTWRDTDGDTWHEFRTPQGGLTELMIGRCGYVMGMRWDDWSGSPTDYNAYIYDLQYNLRASSESRQTAGAQPLEFNQLNNNCPANEYYYFAIKKVADGDGAAGDVLEVLENGLFLDVPSTRFSAGGAFVDSRNPAMAAVGAVDPVTGTTIARYSSQGPTNDGRVKPDLSAGSNFTSWAGTNHRFNGTSAATPAVSGMAALILQRYPRSTPAGLVAHLKGTHLVDRGVRGTDSTYGAGEVILDSLFVTRPAPRITGAARPGATLRVSTGAWSPAPTSFAYQWYRESSAIRGATGSSYRVTSADSGKRLKVRVTARRANVLSEATTSAFTARVPRSLTKFRKSPAPKVRGTAKEGSTLTAAPRTWSPRPTSFTYQWYRGSAVIAGATRSTYRPTVSDVGKRLRVRVTAHRTGYVVTHKLSAYTKPVKALRTFSVAPRPRISGAARVGATLTATPGAWSPAPTRLTYQWRRGGSPIAGATGRSYRITAADGGSRMSVTVTAARQGFRTTARTSAPTTAVPGDAACTRQLVTNPGFESGATGWSTSPATGVIYSDGANALTGQGYAWLGGHGKAATDVLSTRVAVPTGCATTLRYSLRIATNEATTQAFDVLTVRVDGTAAQWFSNRDATNAYASRTLDLSPYAGRTVTVSWTAVEDADTLTTFLLDDVTATGTTRP